MCDHNVNFWDFVGSLSAAGVGEGEGAARPAAAASSSSDASNRLESSSSNRKQSPPNTDHHDDRFHGRTDLVALCPKRCRCRTCHQCGPKMGWLVRQAMLVKAHLFRRPALLSLTVARDHFADPEAAHVAISDGGYIRRLLRLLGVTTWLWVLEFQTNTGDGWPHWHILIDLDDLPGGRIDLQRAWKLWRDKWQLGGLDLSVKRSFSDPAHAMLYITKYLTKTPDAFPLWVMTRTRAIRFVGGCKALGSLTGQPPRETKDEAEPVIQPNLPFRNPRTLLLARMAKCGMASNVFAVYGDNQTGEGTWSYMGTIEATPEDVVDLGEQGMVSLRGAVVDWGDQEMLVVTGASVGGIVTAIRRFKREVKDREVGYVDAWNERVMERAAELWDAHAAFWDRPEPRHAGITA